MTCRKVFVQPKDSLLQLLSDYVLLLAFLDPDEGPGNVQYGQIGHRAAVVQASAFKIGVLALGEEISELQQQPRFADSCFTHDADDLAFS